MKNVNTSFYFKYKCILFLWISSFFMKVGTGHISKDFYKMFDCFSFSYEYCQSSYLAISMMLKDKRIT